jgi:hypothetical protein
MSTNKLYIILLFAFLAQVAQAQSSDSYGAMENRFTKTKLTAADSTAFRETGYLKAQSLFEYGDVYISNYSNAANQAYVIQRVPDLFYIAEGDTLNTDSVMMMVNVMIENERPKPIKLELTDKEGVLGHVVTKTKKLHFEADIVLVKEPKKFGNTEEKIWQVFLANPIFW